MPDEQTPEDQPTAEPMGEIAPQPPMVEPPRMPTGWIVSGLIFLLWISSAISGYFTPPKGEPSLGQLQQEFENQVSVAFGSPERLEGERGDGVRVVLKDALKDAGEHEEAARIAVVAAYELGEKPDGGALATLRASEDELSNDIATVYSGMALDESFVEAFTSTESDEFVVRLAQAHALEMTGEDGGRGSFLDKDMNLKTRFVATATAAGVIAGVICLGLFVKARSERRLRPVGFGGIKKLDGDRLMMRFACYMVGYTFIGYSVQLLSAPTNISGIWTSAIVLLLVAAFVIAMLNVPFMDKVDSLKRIIGGCAKDFWKNVGVGLYGYLCTVPVLIVVLTVVFQLGDLIPSPTHPVGEEMVSANRFDWIAIALTASILAPFIEELTFRGLLFPALIAQLKRPLWAILACGLLFAAIHPQGPVMWPALMMTGGTAAYVRYYTGSLVPSITLHVLNNSVILAFALFLR